MTLPEEVRVRLATRAATDLDIAALLEMYSKPDRTVSEPSPEQGIGNVEKQNL
jgi:hypothetical protein